MVGMESHETILMKIHENPYFLVLKDLLNVMGDRL